MTRTGEYFSKPIAALDGMTTRTEAALKRLYGGGRMRDMLFHLPVSTIDRTYSPLIAQAEAGRVATMKLRITGHSTGHSPRAPHRVSCEDGTGKMSLVFFGKFTAYHRSLTPAGGEICASGKLSSYDGALAMNHPDIIANASQFAETAVIEPVYPLTRGITNKTARKFAEAALAGIPDGENPRFAEALRRAHKDPSDARARAELGEAEALAHQLRLALDRAEYDTRRARPLIATGEMQKALLASLGFEPTRAQRRVLDEILADMGAPKRMLRLLQGDVGSGKTFVALMSLLAAAEAGAQGALMAPTEILANQHYATISRMLSNAGIDAGLVILTSRDKGAARRAKLGAIADGAAKIAVGTHALFQDGVSFANLGLAVIDEQHKFGVAQRAALGRKAEDGANILAMTATPIPRTLAMTNFGDMDISAIDELPPGRKPIETRIASMSKIEEIAHALLRKMRDEPSLKAYWVCPLVNESDKVELSAVKRRFEELREIFGTAIAMAHGQADSDRAIESFADPDGEARLLLATTIIEVGVDVPKATLMFIEHAERFGLATLHQLRGRIGRGGGKSTCVLLHSDRLSPVARERLSIMRSTTDGFKIAEEDLRLRGGGDIAGLKQSGGVDFRLCDIDADPFAIARANEEAKKIARESKTLAPRHAELLEIFGLDKPRSRE
ncbi:MAG: ATP-dependent DNA helicase RecG [Rickettsiales bacterium]|jgi:ATP-dependent DNA helicase RecG|nr:ATP-dependent DNA helicase RecG [Rickettsiales bacterium]